jgi:hypothetical protein
MAPTEQDRHLLRVFRAVAADLRTAWDAQPGRSGGLRVVNGVIETAGSGDWYRKVCVPLRRTTLTSDKAYFGGVLRVACEADPPQVRAQAAQVRAAYDALSAELDEALSLGGTRVRRREMFRAWIDAVIFYDDPEKCRPFERMVESYGRIVETTSQEMAQAQARQVLALDDVLEEWNVVPTPPPPLPTPPPPPDPTWFTRLIDRLRGRQPT